MPYAHRVCSKPGCGRKFRPRNSRTTCWPCEVADRASGGPRPVESPKVATQAGAEKARTKKATKEPTRRPKTWVLKSDRKRETRTHMVIPDCQVKPGVDISHMAWIGQYAADKQPDVIVCIGDFADMPSLSHYDKGTRSAATRTYAEDVASVHTAMRQLLAPIKAVPGYKPRLVLTLGNHEDRIRRAVEEDGRLYGTMSVDDLQYKEFGWEVYDFLDVVVIDGIAYSHFFVSGSMGRPVSSARALVRSRHMSATMGHVQETDIDMGDVRADGKQIIGLFCGTCYLHDEPYLGPQGNCVRRQIVMKHEVDDGQYDPMLVSLDFLRRKYGTLERKAA